jgi:cation diffusion facilitator CzcD-associated flavoprotein CzcO
MNPTAIKTAIIGSGFAGLGMAMRLRDEGDDDFLVFEKANGVGGVWRDNIYPGCGCDVQSHLYEYSFAPKPDWSRVYALQPEILGYLETCVRDRGLSRFLRLGEAVCGARWDEPTQRWHLESEKGTYVARHIVLAAGALSDPKLPSIPGVETFAGPIFHTARWRSDVDLAGKHVAVIGTGASAIQVVPNIQPKVRALTLFQRTPPWVMKRRDRAISKRWRAIYERVPFMQRFMRFALRYAREVLALCMARPAVMRLVQRVIWAEMRSRMKDPVKIALAEPRYTLGCKRVLISDDYLEALDQANVSLQSEAISSITPMGIATADGRVHNVDIIVLATGFGLTTVPLYQHIIGRDGVSLAKAYSPPAKAYYGASVPGFPNMFCTMGPNSGLGHSSALLMMEAQVAHAIQAMRYIDANGLASVEVSRQAVDELTDELVQKLAGSVWQTGGCRSWYQDENGHNYALWPGTTRAFEVRARRFDPTAYVTRR